MIQSILNQSAGTIQMDVVAEEEDLTCSFLLQFGPEEAAPKTTISIALVDYTGLLAGELNPQQAFMAGKIRIAGDMTLPMTLMTLLSQS